MYEAPSFGGSTPDAAIDCGSCSVCIVCGPLIELNALAAALISLIIQE